MSSTPLKVTSAVSRVQAAQLAIMTFRQKHATVMTEYDELLNDYNDAVSEAKNLVRDNAEILPGKRAGDFSVKTVHKVVPELLIEALGEETAAPYIEYKPTLNRENYDRDVALKVIPPEVVAVCETTQHQVTGPKEVDVWTMGGSRGKGGRRGG